MILRIHNRSFREWLIIVIFLLLIFQMALQSSENRVISTIFNYIDEAIAAICLVYITLRLLSGYKFKLYDKTIFISGIIFWIIGFISSMVSRIQSFSVCLIDFFTCAKFLIGYLTARMYWGNISKGFLRKNLNWLCRFFAVTLCFLALHDELMSPFFPLNDKRYGLYSIQLMFTHPTFLAAACSLILIVLAASDHKRDNLFFMISISIVILLTLRSKAIAFATIFWMLYIFVSVLNLRNKYIYVAFGLIIALYLGYDRIISYYFSTTWAARSVMLTDAIHLAKDYFPLGAGYASFGTNMSVRSYSAVYYLLGYDSIHGMSQSTAAYLNDGMWQAIIGQFGLLGTISFIVIILYLFKTAFLFSPQKVGFMTYNAMLCLNLFFLISSLGEMAYFAPYALLMFIIMGIIINENSKLLRKTVKNGK